jgi:hypothetical protein
LDVKYKKIEAEATKSAIKIGKFWKMKIQRRKYLKIKNDILRVQSTIRKFMVTSKFYKIKLAKKLIK